MMQINFRYATLIAVVFGFTCMFIGPVDAREHGVEDLAADVVEVDVHALRAMLLEAGLDLVPLALARRRGGAQRSAKDTAPAAACAAPACTSRSWWRWQRCCSPPPSQTR